MKSIALRFYFILAVILLLLFATENGDTRVLLSAIALAGGAMTTAGIIRATARSDARAQMSRRYT